MMKEKWYAMPQDAVLARFGSDSAAGLSPKAARTRLRVEGENDVFALPHSSARSYAAYLVSDITLLLLLLAAALGALFDRSGISGAVLVVLAVGVGASIAAYIGAHRIMESMAVCTMPRVRVLRGGRLYAVDVRELVRGDVILLETGDIVPGDARLINAEGLEVMEYTGKIGGKAERGRSAKDASAVYPADGIRTLAEQKNMVFAGSLVLAGQARAVVVEVGFGCFIVSTEGQIPLLSSRGTLPEMAAFEKVCGRVSLLMLILILPLVLLGLFLGGGPLGLMDYFLLAAALAVSSMSELTVGWGSYIAGRGVRGAAVRGDADVAVLPHAAEIPAIASADTLVLLDETALTEGRLSVTAAWSGLNRLPSPGEKSSEPWTSALLAAGLPSASTLRASDAPDPALDALLRGAAGAGVTAERIRQSVHLLDTAPASAFNRFSTALFEENRSLYAVCAGDLHGLLGRCTRAVDTAAPGGTCLMRAERRDALLAAVDAELAQGGYAVAYARRSSPCNHLRRLSMLQEELTLVGVLVFTDRLGGKVRAAVDSLAARGVRTRLFADADAERRGIVSLAAAAGILRDGVIARAPAPIPPDAELCLGYDPAARQRHLVSYGEAGHTVIGVGASVPDLAAIRACRVGAACTPVELRPDRARRPLNGADEYYGSELLKKNAGLLIRRAGPAGGGVGGVLSAVLSAGQILQNLAVAMRYLFAAQAFRLAALVLTIRLGMPVLMPLHLLFCGLIADSAALLALAFTQGEADRGMRFFDAPIRRCAGWICTGLCCGAAAGLTAFLLRAGGVLADGAARGFLFLAMVLAQAILLPICCHAAGGRVRWLQSLLYAGGGVLFVLLCLVWPAFGAVFCVMPMSVPACFCLLIAPVSALFGGEILRTTTALRDLRGRDDAQT